MRVPRLVGGGEVEAVWNAASGRWDPAGGFQVLARGEPTPQALCEARQAVFDECGMWLDKGKRCPDCPIDGDQAA